MNRREAIAGALAVASVGALPPGVAAAAAGPFRVFRLNEYECYMARSLEEALAAAAADWFGAATPLTLEEAEANGLVDDPGELTDEELDTLRFCDCDERGRPPPESTWPFREELARRAAMDPTPQLFACTEW